MNYKKLPGDLFQVEYYDERGMILFEETLTELEVDKRSNLMNLSEEKFLKALVDQPAEIHKVFE
ncbi:MAG: hypothetical protein RIG77_18575 [Cyclobacteriaceae bacterium]